MDASFQRLLQAGLVQRALQCLVLAYVQGKLDLLHSKADACTQAVRTFLTASPVLMCLQPQSRSAPPCETVCYWSMSPLTCCPSTFQHWGRSPLLYLVLHPSHCNVTAASSFKCMGVGWDEWGWHGLASKEMGVLELFCT